MMEIKSIKNTKKNRFYLTKHFCEEQLRMDFIDEEGRNDGEILLTKDDVLMKQKFITYITPSFTP